MSVPAQLALQRAVNDVCKQDGVDIEDIITVLTTLLVYWQEVLFTNLHSAGVSYYD